MNNIPKILHLYWGKNNPLTFLQYLTVVSFREHHPNWVIKVYYPINTCDNISWNTFEQKTKIISKDYFNELDKHNVEKIKINFENIGFKNNYPEVIKSDYFRYYILYKEGGIWSDFDILYTTSIENIDYSNFINYGQHDNINFYINYSKYSCNTSHYSIGFIASTPGNKIIETIINNCKKYVDNNNYQAIGNKYLKKILGTPEQIYNNFNISILVLPKSFYLPICYTQINNIFYNKSSLPSNCIGIHWFNGHPTARDFQNKLEKNINSKAGTLWVYIEKYLKYKTL